MPQIQRGKLEACQAAAAVAHVIIGGDEVAAGRAEKPAASIFLRACALAGCWPHEVGSEAGSSVPSSQSWLSVPSGLNHRHLWQACDALNLCWHRDTLPAEYGGLKRYARTLFRAGTELRHVRSVRPALHFGPCACR